MFNNLVRRAKAIFRGRSEMSINGLVVEGSNMEIVGNKVFVDGREVDFGPKESLARIEIHISGDCQIVQSQSGDVTVSGSVDGDVSSQSGNISIHNVVQGDVKTMSGDVTVSGSIGGKVSTMSGDISSKR